ncbi:tetratricopeptide repeat protein [Candidatus Zixiibacteriota bacterium]
MRENNIAAWRLISIGMLVVLFLCPGNILWADEIADFERGNQLLAEQSYDEALTAYQLFVNQNPDHHLASAAYWNMANIYMIVNQDYEKAAPLFQGIVDQHPDSEWGIFASQRLGRCHEAQEQWAQAAEIYQPTVRRLSAADDAAVTTAWTGELKRRLITSYRNAGEHERIIGLYEEVLSENPAAPSAPEDQFHLAGAFLEMDELEEAAENFVLVVERYPAAPFARQVHQEQADLVSEELGYHWEMFAAFQSGQELLRAGQFDEAAARFDEVIDGAPAAMADAAVFQKHLIEYQRSGNAVALRGRIAAGRERYPFGFGGVAVNGLNDVLRDICRAQETVESNPGDAAAYQQIGIGYYRTQAYQCGMDAYREAIAIDPQNPLAHNMLGYCCVGAGKLEEAVSAFHQLVEVAPDDPNSYDSLAEGYYELGDTTRAMQYYQQALAVDSTFSNSYFMLGTIYQGQDQRAEAIAHFEKYLELDPGGFQAQGARAQLEQLRPADQQ